MASGVTAPAIRKGQLLHAVCLAVLLALVVLAWTWLGEPSAAAFWMAVAFPVIHQVFVWLAWRWQLQLAERGRSLNFPLYLVVFFVLFGGRFVTLFVLGWLDRGSLGLAAPLWIGATVVCAVPGIYAAYSVKRYFGMARAAGADHFDPRYPEMPLVREGIFRFTNNGMYVFAFLLFWAIAIGCNSTAALAVVAFSHAYIWVHFHATEKPDMEYLYQGFTAPRS